MKLIYTSSPSHDILRDLIFLGTLPDEDWELVETHINIGGNGDYRSTEWKEVIINRARQRLELVKECKGELLVFSDVDVQWFRPAQEIICQELQSKDIVFQAEMPKSEKINGGFMACRSTSETIELFSTTLELLERRKQTGMIISDQETFNGLIIQKKMPCSYGQLPHSFMNDNFLPKADDVIMYHSIRTIATQSKTSIQQKIEQHLRAREYVLGTSSIFKDAKKITPPGEAGLAGSVPQKVEGMPTHWIG